MYIRGHIQRTVIVITAAVTAAELCTNTLPRHGHRALWGIVGGLNPAWIGVAVIVSSIVLSLIVIDVLDRDWIFVPFFPIMSSENNKCPPRPLLIGQKINSRNSFHQRIRASSRSSGVRNTNIRDHRKTYHRKLPFHPQGGLTTLWVRNSRHFSSFFKLTLLRSSWPFSLSKLPCACLDSFIQASSLLEIPRAQSCTIWRDWGG